MNKFGAILIIIVLVVAAYLFLTLVMPMISDMASTANETIGNITDPSQYPGAQAGVLAAPLIMYFVPGAIGIIVVIIILRRP